MSKNTSPTTAPTTALTKQNLIDKAVAYLAPGWALQRQSQRNQLALSGGYVGAKIDRAQLSRWMPLGGSPATDIIRDLPMLRARSRDQMRNAPVALGALNTTVSHVVGTGLTYTPSIDAKFLGLSDEQAAAWSSDTKRRFNAWAKSKDCDAARQLDFYGLQDLAFRSTLESGDIGALTPRIQRTKNSPPRLAVQLIEADRICNPNREADTDSRIDGVEIDPSTGEAKAVYVARQHPGNILSGTNKWDRVDVRGQQSGRLNFLLLFRLLRPGQVRGVPLIAPILEPLKQLNRWSDAELNAAVISGLQATFVTMDPEAFDTLYEDDAKGEIVDKAMSWSGEMESGQAINLLPGENIASPTPGRPNPEFDPFWTAMVRQIGMALELPYEVLVMHFQSSYSASRAALLMAWKGFRTKRDFMSKNFCQPIFELWLADEVAEGRISCPGFFANDIIREAWSTAIWTGDGPGSIDPSKEIDAAQKRVDLGISNKQIESILHDGVDWEQKHQQRVKEINAEKRDGIYFPPAGTPAPVAPPPSDDDADKSTSRTDDAIAALSSTHAASFDQINQRISDLAAQPHNITVNTPPVTVNAGDVHVTPPAITVEGHEINVNMPEGMVQLEATVESPSVQVATPPAQITVVPAAAVQETYQRDGQGNLTGKTIQPIANKL